MVGFVASVLGSAPSVAKDVVAAKQQFGMIIAGSKQTPGAYGFYTKGCLAGGVKLDDYGPAWQTMRPFRNRAWAHPEMIDFIKWLSVEAQAKDGWPGLLVGDLTQPRGGPMLSGHRSHQVGLDADIWLTPMPDRKLTRVERDTISATWMLRSKTEINTDVFTPAHHRILKRAASHPRVLRIFVNPVIKEHLCDVAGDDNAWLWKIRPTRGHDHHFHVRMKCPEGQRGCRNQNAPARKSGCGAEIRDWMKRLRNPPRPKPVTKPTKPRKPRAPMTLANLPSACRTVLTDGKPGVAKGRVAPSTVGLLPTRRPR